MNEDMRKRREGEGREGRNRRKNGAVSEKRRRRRRLRRLLKRGLILLIPISIACYVLVGFGYRKTFLPNTEIGGITVGGMTADAVMAEIDEEIGRYELIVEERDGTEERIRGREIGLSAVYDGSLEKIQRSQNPFLWGLHLLKGEAYPKNCIITFNREKMMEAIASLSCMDPLQITEPADAFLAFDKETGLGIVPEVRGNSLDEERLFEEIAKAVQSLEERISLEERKVYQEPVILSHDPALSDRLKAWKPYTDVTVTYRFGARSEVLDGSTIWQWLSDDGLGNAVLDRSAVEAYVRKLAEKYNTAYCLKEFRTAYGPTVTITKGHYGWLIDKEAETDALMEIIQSGQNQEREPVYAQKAASHDGPDYGDTYVEMNLTAQHLYYYKDGKLVVESDFVSGNEAKGWSTPDGAYGLTYKQKNAVLKGKNYKTPVTYWMPFNGNIGMHDGYWRSSFGGTIYKNNGSHGCINLPPAAAKTIFESIEAGTPVLCYHLAGTESRKTTAVPSENRTGNGKEKETNGSFGKENAGEKTAPAGQEKELEAAGVEKGPEAAGQEKGPEAAGQEKGPEAAGAEKGPEAAEQEKGPEAAGAEKGPEVAGAEKGPEAAGAEKGPEAAKKGGQNGTQAEAMPDLTPGVPNSEAAVPGPIESAPKPADGTPESVEPAPVSAGNAGPGQ